MKRKLAILVAALCCIAGFAPTTNAISLNIEIGDRAYYVHGARYFENGTCYVWVPGHWRIKRHHKFWVHGHYRIC